MMPLSRSQGFAIAVVAMAIVVLLANILVQYPLGVSVGRLNLADLLTWGAFSYPLAFLVTDLTNRLLGAQTARRVVYAGFAVAVVLSIYFSTPRIAIASGSAFLVAQLLDVGVFNALRDRVWWKAPAFSSLLGSFVDTLMFFSLAFAPFFAILGPNDAFAVDTAPFFGLFAVEAPRWLSWAAGDFLVKLAIAALALIPYRVAIALVLPPRPLAQ